MEREQKIRQSKILVVDDLIANVSLLENILNRLGYKQIKSVTDPRLVMSAVGEWKPDIIILDLAMPHVNGYKIMDELRTQVPKENWIPILVLTADTDPGTKRKALAAGATEFLPKPFDSSEIVLRIRNLLLMRILHAELRDQNVALEERVLARTKSLSERTGQLESALEELKQTQKQLVQQERFRAFGEMAGGVAHDFNNVLMCVIGYTDLMLQDPSILDEKETVKGFIQTMNTAGLDASKIVARLRNFYRPREETEIFTALDLNALIEEIVPLTQPKWQAQALASGKVVDLQLELETLPLVACNAAEMRELAVNLIFNAVDAMPSGGTVTLRTKVVRNHVLFGVSDTGTGMTHEVRQRCMEPFFSTKGDEGTGLGLSMVFGITKRHEGDVEIESELGKGTTVWISLPVQEEPVESFEERQLFVTRPLAVLAVDDDPLSRDIVSRYLEADGHRVVTAENGLEALSRYEAEDFDLVITDHAMPGMTGVQLSAAITKKVPHQPIIMLTASSDPRLQETRHTSGPHAMLIKPVSQNALRHAIGKLLANTEELVSG